MENLSGKKYSLFSKRDSLERIFIVLQIRIYMLSKNWTQNPKYFYRSRTLALLNEPSD